jgi:hypothetical protein
MGASRYFHKTAGPFYCQAIYSLANYEKVFLNHWITTASQLNSLIAV